MLGPTVVPRGWRRASFSALQMAGKARSARRYRRGRHILLRPPAPRVLVHAASVDELKVRPRDGGGSHPGHRTAE
jgi:hypothetical protein